MPCAVGSAADFLGLALEEIALVEMRRASSVAKMEAGDPGVSLDLPTRALLTVAPTLGARVAAASVTGRLHGPAAGLALLAPLSADAAVARFQPYWAARAHLLAEAGRPGEAAEAYERAVALTDDEAVRAYLRERQARQVCG